MRKTHETMGFLFVSEDSVFIEIVKEIERKKNR